VQRKRSTEARYTLTFIFVGAYSGRMRRLRVLTSSELKTRRRCAREHHIAYELGIRPVHDAEPLAFGTALHRALDAWWRCPLITHRFAWALAALPDDMDPYARERGEQMLAGYDVRWSSAPLELVHSPRSGELCAEIEFAAALLNPYTGKDSRTFSLAGKLDAIVRDTESGLIYILEHKTTSEDIAPGSTYWDRLRMDAQVSLYYHGARALGFDNIAGCIYDVLRKPAQRPLVATPPESRKYTKGGALIASQRELDETPRQYAMRVAEAIASDVDRFYARGVIVRFEREEAEALWDVWQDARNIREAELAQRWPRNPDACERYGRMCSYWDVCTGVTALDDATQYRRADSAHEELAHE
jgi:PD-(D/E)XK nuclease superfamily